MSEGLAEYTPTLSGCGAVLGLTARVGTCGRPRPSASRLGSRVGRCFGVAFSTGKPNGGEVGFHSFMRDRCGRSSSSLVLPELRRRDVVGSKRSSSHGDHTVSERGLSAPILGAGVGEEKRSKV